MEKLVVDVRGLADMLGCSASNARALVESGRIPAINIGSGVRRKCWRIRIEDARTFIDSYGGKRAGDLKPAPTLKTF